MLALMTGASMSSTKGDETQPCRAGLLLQESRSSVTAKGANWRIGPRAHGQGGQGLGRDWDGTGTTADRRSTTCAMISLHSFSSASQFAVPGATHSTLQDFRFPDSSGGYTYEESDSCLTATANRLIVWKVSKDTIELNEVSTDMELQGSQLKLRLQNTPILEGISVNETHDEVVILLATIGSLHRLRFPHPRRLPHPTCTSSGARIGLSVFHNFCTDSLRDPHNFHVLSSVYPIYGAMSTPTGPVLVHSWIQNRREAVFILANPSGTLVCVRMDAEKVQSFEFRSNNFMDKLKGFVPSMMRSSQDSDEAALCLSSHSFADDTIIFGLCRDLKIRFWSFSRQKSVHAVSLQVPEDMDSSGLTVRRPAIRKVDSGDALVIVLFLNVNDLRQFSVYKITYRNSVIEAQHVASLNTEHGEDLVDFQVYMDELLYLTYNSRMQSRVKRGSLKESHVKWSCLNSESGTRDHKLWTSRELIDEIFFRGNFLWQTVAKALSAFTRSPADSFTALRWSEMVAKAVREVENQKHARSMSADLSDTELGILERDSWEKLYMYCIQYHSVSCKPLSLVVDSQTGFMAVMQKSHILLITRPDLHTNFLMDSNTTSFPDEALAESQPLLLPSIRQVIRAIHSVSRFLNDEACYLFESELRKGHRVSEAAAIVLDTCLLTTEETGDTASHATLKSCISSIHSHAPAFDEAVEFLIKQLDLSLESMELEGSENRSSMDMLKHLLNSAAGRAVLTDGLKSLSKKRFEFSRNFLLFMSVVVQLRDKTGLTMDKIEKTRSVTLKLLEEHVHNYFILFWSCQATMDDDRKPNVSCEVDEAHLNVLELTEYIRVCRLDDRKPAENTSLLMKFLEFKGRHFVMMMVSEKYAAAGQPPRFGWESVFPDCVLALAQLLWPSSTSFLLPEFMIGCKQYALLTTYVSLMDCWVQWNSFSRTFLTGFVSLVNGDPGMAVQHFNNAIFGVTTEPFLRHFAHVTTVMDTTMDGESFLPSEAVFNYYTKVIQLFKNQSEPEAIVSLAETAIVRLDPATDTDFREHISCLYTTMFLYRLGLDQHAEAYDVMVMNPDVLRRKDCLRQFIVRLYESNCCTKLLSFNFSDFSDEFVTIIESKARSCDLSNFSGCGYYELLYSYYARGSNFRRAASIMFEYARRLSQEVPGMESLTKQVSCYLITLNSLMLVNQKYAWIVKPTLKSSQYDEAAAATESVRKRSISEQPKEKAVKREIDVLDITDIRKEYEMARARLKLLTKAPKLNEIASCILTPGEVLTLLVSNGLYDASFQLAKVMDLSMKPIFEGLVSRYVRFAQLPLFEMRSEDSLSEFYECFTENDSVVQSFLGTTESPAISKMWHLISLYLEKHEDKNQSSLHHCVTERLLMSGICIPTSLKHSYQKRNCPELIWLLLTYDNIEDAAELTLDLIDNILATGFEDHQPVYFPHCHVQNLLQILYEQRQEKEDWQRLHSRLTNKLRSFEDLSLQESRLVLA